MARFVLLLAACCSLFSATVVAYPPAKQFALAHLQEQVKLDGNLDEHVWKNATQIAVNTQNEPLERAASPVNTTAYLLMMANSYI